MSLNQRRKKTAEKQSIKAAYMKCLDEIIAQFVLYMNVFFFLPDLSFFLCIEIFFVFSRDFSLEQMEKHDAFEVNMRQFPQLRISATNHTKNNINNDLYVRKKFDSDRARRVSPTCMLVGFKRKIQSWNLFEKLLSIIQFSKKANSKAEKVLRSRFDFWSLNFLLEVYSSCRHTPNSNKNFFLQNATMHRIK